jgi:hypothetical protein
MGSGVAVRWREIVSGLNVVSLVDILLVLLVIFMIIPHKQGSGPTCHDRLERIFAVRDGRVAFLQG